MLTPRKILGNPVVDQIRETICKLGVKPEHIYEIVLDVEKSVSTVETYSQKISPSELPCVLYFITHLYRSDDSHEVSLIKHEMNPNGKHRTGFDHSLFSFQYRILQKNAHLPGRFRTDYLKISKDLKPTPAKSVFLQIMEFAKKYYPRFKMEMRADNLVAAYMARNILKNPQFIFIQNDFDHQVDRKLKPEFIELLAKIELISPLKATKLHEFISLPVDIFNIEEKNKQYVKIHNALVEAIRENLPKKKSGSFNEVIYFFEKVMKNPEGSKLVSESPYQGDLWIEGGQP